MLRVRRAQILGLIDDMSEAMAECTPNTVGRDIIEIFIALNPDSFLIAVQRNNDANWINIRSWGA